MRVLYFSRDYTPHDHRFLAAMAENGIQAFYLRLERRGHPVLVLLALATVFTLFIGHVHATQDLLDELQQARRENLRLHLQHNRLKGEFDQATGPSVIYERAGAMGLEEGIAYGPTIRQE